MAAPRVTLIEVARRAGVSRTTASFVMTGRTDMRISAEASERVLRAARELNYRPNLMARSLRTSMTQTIGLISDTVATEAFAGEMIRGSLATALQHERLLCIGETGGDAAVTARLVQDLLDRGVDGFVYATMYTRQARLSPVLRGHPLVLLNCRTSDRRIPAVVPDELGAGRTAASALLEAGHRDHVYVVGEPTPDVFAARERLAGVEEVFSCQGLQPAGTVACRWWPEAAYHAVTAFLATGARVTALICLNDRIALGAYQALAEAGRHIPDDVSVISFDDSDLASWLRPRLTSIAIPHFELGRQAVELLLEDGYAGGIHLVPMPLRRRDSVAVP
jgi:LacI family transcriptional regulator